MAENPFRTEVPAVPAATLRNLALRLAVLYNDRKADSSNLKKSFNGSKLYYNPCENLKNRTLQKPLGGT